MQTLTHELLQAISLQTRSWAPSSFGWLTVHSTYLSKTCKGCRQLLQQLVTMDMNLTLLDCWDQGDLVATVLQHRNGILETPCKSCCSIRSALIHDPVIWRRICRSFS